MWIGSLYKNGPTQHICMSGVHSSTYYFSFGHHLIELIFYSSFFEVRKLCLIMFPLIFVLCQYNNKANIAKYKYYILANPPVQAELLLHNQELVVNGFGIYMNTNKPS